MIVLLFGRPGAGKFTVGRALAEETGFRLLHNHAIIDLVESIFPFGSVEFVRLREELWLHVVDAAVAAGESVILTFAPEATVTDDFISALASRGELRLIELRCAPEELERRLGDESRKKFGKVQSAAFYRELEAKGMFDRPVMPPAELVVDTGSLDARAAARLIATHLRG